MEIEVEEIFGKLKKRCVKPTQIMHIVIVSIQKNICLMRLINPSFLSFNQLSYIKGKKQIVKIKAGTSIGK